MIVIVWGHTANEFTEILERFNLSFLLQSGRFATGVFLFLSGYGLTLSIKRNKIDWCYAGTRIRKLLFPYLIFWAFYLLASLLTGHFPAHGDICVDFFSLKMPNADTWFFRTILAVYVLYFCLAKFMKRYAGIGMTLLIALYVAVLIYYDVPSWWWNTILCFPVGIFYASCPGVRRGIPVVYFFLWGGLFVVLYKFSPAAFLREIFTPVIVVFIFAHLSPKVCIRYKFPIISYIGTNSLYMYLMEAIPIDYMSSDEVGCVVYVVGGIVMTVVLTYCGKLVENYMMASGRVVKNLSRK